MKAYVFPGQGAQFSGMGLELYNQSVIAKELFDSANSILGFVLFIFLSVLEKHVHRKDSLISVRTCHFVSRTPPSLNSDFEHSSNTALHSSINLFRTLFFRDFERSKELYTPHSSSKFVFF